MKLIQLVQDIVKKIVNLYSHMHYMPYFYQFNTSEI